MTQFDDREKAFEKKFELDEEMQFKVLARTARLFGLWAAGQMKMPQAEAESYAAQMAEFVVKKPDHESLMARIEQDLAAKGVTLSRRHLEKEMNECESRAQREAT